MTPLGHRLSAGAALLVLGLAFAAPVAAQPDPCDLPEIATDDRPDPEGVPTLVSIGLDLLDLVRIDGVNQQMRVDFLLTQSWRDPRLQGLAGCKIPLAQVWSPGTDFLNSGRVFTGLPRQVRIADDGAIVYVQRYRGDLSFPHHLQRFPFDRHVLEISAAVFSSDESEVKLLIDSETMGRADTLLIPDWRVGEESGRIGQVTLNPGDPPHSRFDFLLEVKRRSDYYVWKIIVPLSLIVAMSWSVFWLNPARFGPQIGLSATSMLTLIAFQFAMSGLLPRLSYFTLLDRYITMSTILVFLALLQTLTASYLVSIDRSQLAQRLDRVCRWLFPAVFGAVTALAFTV